MSKARNSPVFAVAALCAVCLLPAARGAEPEQATPHASNPFGTRAIGVDALANSRGGTDGGGLGDMKLNGVVSDNRASNLTTGNNVITDGAFAGASGVPLVVQNSGNNVLIQSATIINVTVK